MKNKVLKGVFLLLVPCVVFAGKYQQTIVLHSTCNKTSEYDCKNIGFITKDLFDGCHMIKNAQGYAQNSYNHGPKKFQICREGTRTVYDSSCEPLSRTMETEENDGVENVYVTVTPTITNRGFTHTYSNCRRHFDKAFN